MLSLHVLTACLHVQVLTSQLIAWSCISVCLFVLLLLPWFLTSHRFIKEGMLIPTYSRFIFDVLLLFVIFRLLHSHSTPKSPILPIPTTIRRSINLEISRCFMDLTLQPTPLPRSLMLVVVVSTASRSLSVGRIFPSSMDCTVVSPRFWPSSCLFYTGRWHDIKSFLSHFIKLKLVVFPVKLKLIEVESWRFMVERV